jgi:hypothetical protein
MPFGQDIQMMRFNPLEYYSERTPLIKRFNEIANMIDGALKEIEQLYGIS